MAGIFISYRRDDAGGDAGRLYDRLVERFGADRVFRDVDTLEPGDRFAGEIREKLERSDVMIALIGKEWLNATDASGRRRLEQPGDFVRMELALAFQRGVPVVPTLLRNTSVPPADALPPDLGPLPQCQAFEIDDASFHDDVTRLITAIEPRVGPSDSLNRKRRWLRAMPIVLVAGIAVILLAVALRVARSSGDRITLRSSAASLTSEQVRALLIEHGFYSSRANAGGQGIRHDYRQEVSAGMAIVRDGATGLTWQQGGPGSIVLGGRPGAEAYVRELNGRRFAGYDDWRLPTLEEALSIMSAQTHANFHLDPVFDPLAAPFIWTADHDAEGRGWVVYYLEGYSEHSILEMSAYVRAVRSD